nr:SRPBCC domain-containing protein [Micromonospora sp. DSM 115978]
YSWHHFQPEHAEFFDWSAEKFAEAARERRSKVSFDLEPVGSTVKLTVIHDDFDPGSLMLEAVSGGWPEILSSLKTLLESGEPLPSTEEPAQQSV